MDERLLWLGLRHTDACADSAGQVPLARPNWMAIVSYSINPVLYSTAWPSHLATQPRIVVRGRLITFTGNSDQSYIGHRYAGNDNTDFVIQLSDNANSSPWGIYRMKFVWSSIDASNYPQAMHSLNSPATFTLMNARHITCSSLRSGQSASRPVGQ